MGLSTFLVGVLPDYSAIGIVAPLLLVMLRVLQGLAIGGEFSGAIVYVAEHASAARRGLHTSCIPAMAIAGLLLSLLVIAATRAAMTPETFAAWGWRVPFLVSVFLLGHLVVDTATPAREPRVRADAGGAAALPRADCGNIPERGEPAARVYGALWCRDRAGDHFLRGYIFTRTTSSSASRTLTRSRSRC
jgi:MFS family permease